ncbi:MAG: 50S ribosomal protein L9 [Chloroflexi bacterium]|nr:50S ribosomal protein L9 [Chloroflexota bacterium]
MKVLLKEDVEKLGYAGEVHAVADGYGRNFLIPRGLAVKATDQAMNQAKNWRDRASARRAQIKAQHDELSRRISETTVHFVAKAGETGKLYGSVTMNDVVEKLNAKLGTTLDRRLVEGDPIRQLGTHHIVVRLSGDYQPQMTVVIQSTEEAAAAAAAVAAPAEVEAVEVAEVPAE